MAEEDLIFGKNRHFFGGIEPSNMLEFNAEMINGTVQITAKLPLDTIVDGQTLCTVAGAIIRKRVDNYPVDEFDGDKVADITTDSTIYDTEVIPKGTYYYAAFPYTKQGVYNRNSKNRSAANEPKPMEAFTASSKYDPDTGKCTVTITALLPDDAVGAIIRRSETRYPVDESDGDEVSRITEDSTIYDNNVEVGHTYYYAAFPYTETKAYNRSEANRAMASGIDYKYYYGYDLNVNSPSSTGRVSYPADVMNAGYSGFTYDSNNAPVWSNGWVADEPFMPKPCMLKYSGEVDYYLNPNDFTKKLDDGSTSDVGNINYQGNAMMQWPKIYTKRWEENGVYHFRCSDKKIDDEYECWCNYDANNNEIDYFYTAIYPAHTYSSKGRSIRLKTASECTKVSNAITSATANGEGWYVESLADRLLIQDLLVLLAKNTNCESVYGPSRNPENTSYWNVHTCTGQSMFHRLSQEESMAFGMQYLWSYRTRRIPGWIWNGTDSNYYKVKITIGTKDGSTTTGYNGDGDGYLRVEGPSAGCNGYISKMKTYKWGRLPVASSGSNATYEADFLSTPSTDNTGNRAAEVGVVSGGTYYSGPFGVSFATLSTKYTSSSAAETAGGSDCNGIISGYAICCKPLAK